MRLETQVQGKPYKSEEVEEQRLTEDLHESNPANQNETLVVRGKREVIYSLKDFCEASNYPVVSSTSPTLSGCEKQSYSCRGHSEVVCNTRFSFGCFGIGPEGKPSCVPKKFETVEIDNKQVRITKACGCAH